MTRGIIVIFKDKREYTGDGGYNEWSEPVLVLYRNGDCFPAVIACELDNVLPNHASAEDLIRELRKKLKIEPMPTSDWYDPDTYDFQTWFDTDCTDHISIEEEMMVDYVYYINAEFDGTVWVQMAASRYFNGHKVVFSGTVEEMREWYKKVDAQAIGFDDEEDVYDENGNYSHTKGK